MQVQIKILKKFTAENYKKIIIQKIKINNRSDHLRQK